MPRGNAVFWAARGGVAAAPAAMSKAAATGKEGTNPGKDGALAAALDDEYHTFEYDLADLERLEEDEGERQHKRKLEGTPDRPARGANVAGPPESASAQAQEHSGAGASSSSTDKMVMLNPHLKHLLAAIEKNRSKVDLTDKELRGLLVDVKPKGSKWASEDKVGQEDLYSACEMVLSELRNYTEHSMPFLVKVNKRDVPDYYDVIKNPMDLGTVARNLKNFKYKSKAEFADDLFLIYRNCFEYNTHPDNIYRVHAAAMKKKTIALMVMVPEIVIRDRADVELADESDDEQKPAPSGAPAAASRECPAPPAVEADLSEVDGARSRSQSLAPARPDEARGTEGVVHPADSGMTEPVKEKTVEREGSSQTEDVEMEDADEDSVTKMWQEVTRQARVFICRERAAVFDVPFGRREPLARDPREMLRFARWNARKNSQKIDLGRAYQLTTRFPGHPSTEAPAESGGAAGRKRPYEEEKATDGSKRRKEAEKENAGEYYCDPHFMPEYLPTCGVPEPPDCPASRLARIMFAEGKGSVGGKRQEPKTFFEEDFFTREGRKRLESLAGRQAGSLYCVLCLVCRDVNACVCTRRAHRLREACPSLEVLAAASPLPHGSAATVDENIAKLKHIKETYYRVSLAKAGLPADDANLSSSSAAGPPNGPRRNVTWVAPEPPPFTSPVNLNDRLAINLFRWSTARLLAHAGFDAAESEALQVATEIGAEFLTNLGRTANKYCESYNRKMSPSEILLHTLSENQIGGVQALESYVKGDIERFGVKLSDLSRRLDAVGETTTASSRAGEAEPAPQAPDSEEDALMFGGFTAELGEDFFGFKELGLDKEYSMNELRIPMRLLKGTQGPAAEGKDESAGKPPQYPPPPKFAPVDLREEIGLLRAFLEQKLVEGGGKIIEDEDTFTRQLPSLPPTGKLISKAALLRKKAPSEALLLRRKKQEEERAQKRKEKDEAKAARMREKSEKKRQREEKKQREREEKKAKKLAAKVAASQVP